MDGVATAFVREVELPCVTSVTCRDRGTSAGCAVPEVESGGLALADSRIVARPSVCSQFGDRRLIADM